MGLGLVAKKTLLLFFLDIIIVLIPFILGGNILLAAFLLPVLINLSILNILFVNLSNKRKSVISLILTIPITITPLVYCFFDYKFGLLDEGGSIFIIIFTLIFNTFPSLLISMVFFILGKIKMSKQKQ